MNYNINFVVLVVININAFILSTKLHYLKYNNDLILIKLINKKIIINKDNNLYKNFIL